jgi:hypothetical protein
MKDIPDGSIDAIIGATHKDSGPSNNKWIRANDFLHDYWCNIQNRWVTFEGGHNKIRDHWELLDTQQPNKGEL